MEIKDLIQGRVYKVTERDFYWLWRFNEIKDNRIWSQTISITSDGSIFDNHTPWGSIDRKRDISDASYEDILWYEQCEKAGKFIPKEEVVIQNRELYNIF